MGADTPARQRVERALLDSEHGLQQVLDNSSAIVFAKDRDGRYIFVNREFERVTGRSAAEMLGRLDEEAFEPALAARFRRNDLRVMDENRGFQFEESADFGQGPRTFLSSKFPLLDSRGVVYAVCGMSADITDRKRLEEAFSAAALAVSQSEEETLYRQLARYLSTILGVDGAFIATVSAERPGELQMLAFHLDGAVRENFTYPLAGTPCETVVGQCYRLYPDRLMQLFPLDGNFRKLGFDCYAGHPLSSAAGTPLGLLAVVSRRPFADPALVEATLRIFAVRINAELERVEAASALRASEAQYRAMFNASDDAIVLWNSQFRRVDVNPAFERLYGWTREEVIGHGVEFPEFSPEHVNARQDIVRRALAGESCHAEHEIVVKSGARLRAEVRAVPFRHAGQPHVLTIARDITERARAEEALRASEEQYRAVFNASADALVLWNSRCEPVDVNPAHERIYGYRRDEMLAGTRTREAPMEHLQRKANIIARALAGEGYHGEIETVRRNGERFPIEVRTIPIQYHGEPHVLAMIRDLTERRRVDEERARLEAQLRQAQKMEAIGQLAGGIAHDFNNLLTSIMGYVLLASQRESTAGDSRLAGYLQQAQRSCERARDLIQQMLMFSRGQRGSPRPVSLASVVQGTLGTLRTGLPETIEVDLALDPSLPAVQVDPAQVEQVLLNLCLNARDAMGGVGHLAIGVGEAKVSSQVCASCRQAIAGEFVQLVVADDGHGMTPEVMERIFEPFYSTKEPGKGSGMGLAMAHGIVHEHGGHIVVESRPGDGTRFRILWPALPGHEPSTETSGGHAPARAPRPALQGSVLVVDDEETVGEFMRELLESWGLDAACVHRPEAALELVRAEPERFDIVITDQSMPRLTGLELARRIKTLRADLPVVLYTGHSDGMTGDDVDTAGVAFVMRKPVDPARLSQVLTRCLAAARGGG
jgi:PAS domain S-box-containing protein